MHFVGKKSTSDIKEGSVTFFDSSVISILQVSGSLFALSITKIFKFALI